MIDLVLFGIQGSGKGTQARVIADRFGLHMFEAGAELRRLAKEKSPLGKKVKTIIEAGHLVPNEIIIEIIENFIRRIPDEKNVLFDGIPRNREQKEKFDALMRKFNRKPKGIVITISKKEALKRLIARRMCKLCNQIYPAMYEKDTCKKCKEKLIIRKDDNEKSIKNRLNAYENETLPVIEMYKKERNLIDINGEQPIEAVTRDIMEALEKSA